MSSILTRGILPASTPPADPNDPARFPPRDVKVARTGVRGALQGTGVVIGGMGVLAGVSALIRTGLSHGAVRPNLPTMLAAAGAALLGGSLFAIGTSIGPRTEHALAAGIPTRAQAAALEGRIPGYTDVVECADGTFAVVRGEAPRHSSGGGSNSGSSSNHSNGSHSNGSSSSGSSSYPSSSSGSTSSGDDSGSSRDSSSNGNPSDSDF